MQTRRLAATATAVVVLALLVAGRSALTGPRAGPAADNASPPAFPAKLVFIHHSVADDWLDGYPYDNVAVFDFYNVLTSNGGDRHPNDLAWETGNYHRWWNGAEPYIQAVASDFAAYGSDPSDSHPTAAGLQKAAGEFVPLLNVFYNRWTVSEATPTPTPTPTHTPTLPVYLPIILKSYTPPVTPTPSPYPTPTLAPTPTGTPPSDRCPVYPTEFAFITDREVYAAPSLVEPAPRQWFSDPAFGTCLARVTDRDSDLSPDDPSPGMANEYARVQSFNADGSRLLAHGTDGTWYLYDAQTLQPLGEAPLGVEPRWDAGDPDLVYYTDVDEKRLMSYDVQTAAYTEIRDFDGDFPGQSLAAVWTGYEGSPSRDRRHWGLMAENQDWVPVAFLVYDRQADQVTIRDMRGVAAVQDDVDHVTMSPLGTYFLASFDRYCQHGQPGDDAHPCGLMVYDQDLTNGRSLLRIIGHYDPALDAGGREVIIYQDIDTDHISMLDLDSGAVTALWEIDFSHTAIGFHFSGLAFDRPGWAVVSTHDDDAASHTWMDDGVFLVELKAGGRVVRLAHTHSIVDESQPVEYYYWAEPHASTNPDLTRLLFTTNWGRFDTGEVEMYMIALPADWPERLAASGRFSEP